MSGIKQPVTQVRLTNVAVVRLKVHGHRYEVACYKNKALSWREGVERDVDEVLQSRHVFANVSKGVMAADEQLMADFGTKDVDVVAKLILDKGEVQVSEKERGHALEQLQKDICVLVADMVVNPQTRRPYPVRMLEQGMRDCHFSIQQHKSAKSQALALIKQLQAQRSMPIERAAMRILVTCEQGEGKAIKKQLQPLLAAIEDEQWGSVEYRLTALLSPGHYRQVEELIAQHKQARAHMEIIDLKTHAAATGGQHASEGEEDDEEEEGTEQEEGGAHPPYSTAAPTATSSRSSSAAAVLVPPPVPLPSRAPLAASSSSTTAVSRAPVKSKKAQRRELAEEDIRTVGERRDWDDGEEDVDISDSAQVRQQQQRQAAKAKKERKKHPQQPKRVEEEEAKAGKHTAARVEDGAEGEEEDDAEEAVQERKEEGEVKRSGRAQRGGGRSADSDDGDAATEGRAKKGSRRRRKPPAQEQAQGGPPTQRAAHSGTKEHSDADAEQPSD